MYRMWMAALFIALLFTGCASQYDLPSMRAGLTQGSPPGEWTGFCADNLLQSGEGNTVRTLVHGQPAQNGGVSLLELAAGPEGKLEYFVEDTADIATFVNLRLQFLSTSGNAYIKIAALDDTGRIEGAIGMAYTGQLPAADARNKWLDLRYKTNYKGEWLENYYHIAEMLSAQFSGRELVRARTYRVSIVVERGQHVLIERCVSGTDKGWAVTLRSVQVKYESRLGDELTVEADLANASKKPVSHVAVSLLPPAAYGVVLLEEAAKTEDLAPGETKRLTWRIKAQRPQDVNGGKPWPLRFMVDDISSEIPAAETQVAVGDPRPGKIFYVMTDDLEPIDSAGYANIRGNSNAWLDSQEFMTQMVYKAEQLNGIAGKYGAKWTHYLAWPAVEGARWAALQSDKGDWRRVIGAIRQSVRRQSQLGHEYAVHLHTDYDPYIPANVLSYNAATDGFWANHLRHGWAHSFSKEGEFFERDSRTGILYVYQRMNDELAAVHGQILTARAGSFDFGDTLASQAMSVNACRKVGLWGSSDADGNIGAATSADFGREIYLTKPDNINAPADNLQEYGLVEFCPTPRKDITYDRDSAAVMDEKTDQGVHAFTRDNKIKPGVHGIVGFTHTMFVMGSGDWRDLEGGQFAALGNHLAYVKEHYVDAGLVQFATASELVRAYLDYYSPELLAVYGEETSSLFGISDYSIRLLGRDIPVDSTHTHMVKVKYPLFLRDDAYYISICKNGQEIYGTWDLPTQYNDIGFSVDDASAVYSMKIYHNPVLYRLSKDGPRVLQEFLQFFSLI